MAIFHLSAGRQIRPAEAGLEILQCIPVVNPADSGTSSLTL